MAVELFANLAETTLASSYTSGGSSISVTSATGFPATGTFRVALGNTAKTIFRVDSVSGTTFTGGAEANDGNASSGQTVVCVGTKAVAERFVQSPGAGNIAAPSGVSGVDRYGPLWNLGPAYVPGNFTWVNQGTIVETSSGDVTQYNHPGEATLTGRMKTKTIGTLTYTVPIIYGVYRDAVEGLLGIGFRESGTGKQVIFGLARVTSPIIRMHRLTNPTSFGGAVDTGALVVVPQILFLRIQYDGTNVKFSYSFDGVVYVLHQSETKTTGFTTAPDQVGVAMYNSSGATDNMSLIGWAEA